MQKAEIADSVSLLTGCTAIFDFYTATGQFGESQTPRKAKLFEVAWT